MNNIGKIRNQILNESQELRLLLIHKNKKNEYMNSTKIQNGRLNGNLRFEESSFYFSHYDYYTNRKIKDFSDEYLQKLTALDNNISTQFAMLEVIDLDNWLIFKKSILLKLFPTKSFYDSEDLSEKQRLKFLIFNHFLITTFIKSLDFIILYYLFLGLINFSLYDFFKPVFKSNIEEKFDKIICGIKLYNNLIQNLQNDINIGQDIKFHAIQSLPTETVEIILSYLQNKDINNLYFDRKLNNLFFDQKIPLKNIIKTLKNKGFSDQTLLSFNPLFLYLSANKEGIQLLLMAGFPDKLFEFMQPDPFLKIPQINDLEKIPKEILSLESFHQNDSNIIFGKCFHGWYISFLHNQEYLSSTFTYSNYDQLWLGLLLNSQIAIKELRNVQMAHKIQKQLCVCSSPKM